MLPLFGGDTGGANAAARRTSALFEYYQEPAYPNIPTWHAVRSDRWKYIHYDELEGVDELYDLKADPHELKNVIAEPANAEQLAKMKAELKTMIEQTK